MARPASAYEAAEARGVTLIDAACPLVLKVHSQVKRFIGQGRHVIVVGHDGHPEVAGVMGQSDADNFTLVETIEEARAVTPPDQPLAYVTQTTLSVDDTSAIINVLRERFPDITGSRKADICYATSNRQTAVKEISKSADTVSSCSARPPHPIRSALSRLRAIAALPMLCWWMIQPFSDLDQIKKDTVARRYRRRFSTGGPG